MHRICEHSSTGSSFSCRSDELRQIMSIKNVVAEHQRATVITDEFLADDERLRNSIWRGLKRVAQVNAPLAAIAEKLLEARNILRSGNDQNVPAPGKQQRG